MEKSSGGSVQNGLSDKMKITQEKPRGEGQGQRPTPSSENVSSDRGSFKIKC